MEQRARKVAVRHLQGVVQTPQRRRERVADTWESTARRGVRLEHQERLVPRLREHCRVDIRLHEVDASLVRQELRELLQRVVRRVVRVREDDGTVVRGVSNRRSSGETPHSCVARFPLPFDSQERQIVRVCLHKAGVPDALGCPGARNTRRDQVVLDRNRRVVLVRLRKQGVLAEEVKLAVG